MKGPDDRSPSAPVPTYKAAVQAMAKAFKEGVVMHGAERAGMAQRNGDCLDGVKDMEDIEAVAREEPEVSAWLEANEAAA